MQQERKSEEKKDEYTIDRRRKETKDGILKGCVQTEPAGMLCVGVLITEDGEKRKDW